MSRQGNRKPALRVIMTVSGGVADVLFKPKGIEVCIFDYDVDGEDGVDHDPDNVPCSIGRWEAQKSVVGCEHWPIVGSAARQVKDHCDSRWRCPRCQRIVRCTEESLAEAGTPCCAQCDEHMEIL